jgi:hypothetical protein
MERTGRSGADTWLGPDHPVCGNKVGFAEILLMPQPPLLVEEANTRHGDRPWMFVPLVFHYENVVGVGKLAG